MSQPIQITVGAGGVNPIAGATEYNNPSLAGISGYVDKSGYGIWGYENFQVLSTGGFRLLNGLTFIQDEVYFFVPVGSAYTDDASSGYTNGFDFNRVVTGLFGRVGWRQTPDSPTLDTTNLVSRGGRKFNDGSFHAMVTLNNIKAIMEQKDAIDAEFNAYLTATTRATILRCLNGVFSEPEYISQSLVYNRDSWSNNDQPIINSGKFVGFQVKVPNKVDLAVQIDSISLYFDAAATFNIYVFNDTKQAPIYTKEVTTVANSQTVVDLTDFVLNYIGGDNHGGIFYIGYFQDELGSAQAIWETNVCFVANQPYGIIPMESDATGTVFNRSQIKYKLQTNGLNPHFSVFRDHTWQIIKKPSLFDNVIGLQMAATVLETLLWTQRSSKDERGLKDAANQLQASLELTGVAPITDGPRTTGLRKQIEQELKRVKSSFFPKPKSVIVGIC